jgi:hypothetical protein
VSVFNPTVNSVDKELYDKVHVVGVGKLTNSHGPEPDIKEALA